MMLVGATIREGGLADLDFLGEMMREAAFPPSRRPTLAEALCAAHVVPWLEAWGRAGDLAVVAVAADGQRLGAAWCRRFLGSEPGLSGFIDAETLVVAIAVVEDQRGAGLGAVLLAALHAAARASGAAALSLSVGRTNPALRLYERLGYRRVSDAPDRPLVLRCAL